MVPCSPSFCSPALSADIQLSAPTFNVTLNPFASVVGYALPYVVSGSIIVSLVMSLPTVGPLYLKALIAQDMFLAGTIVLLIGIMTVIGTFISDLLLLWIDPRIRYER